MGEATVNRVPHLSVAIFTSRTGSLTTTLVTAFSFNMSHKITKKKQKTIKAAKIVKHSKAEKKKKKQHQ